MDDATTPTTTPTTARSVGTPPAPAPGRLAFAWTAGGRQLAVMQSVAQTATGFPSARSVKATPACIVPAGRAGAAPLTMCTSGWRPNSGIPGMLEGAKWTGLVRSFAAAVGFHLPRSIRDTPKASQRDRANDGRYAACHAEKKLGLYFLAQQMRFAGVGLQDALSGRLRDVGLPQHRRRARIYLGHKPCTNCLDFLRMVRRRTGIDVRTTQCPVFTEHARQRMFYHGAAPVTAAAETDAASPAPERIAITVDSDDDDGDDGDDDDDEDHQPQAQDGDADDSNEDDVVMDDAPDVLDSVEAVLATFPVGNVSRPRAAATAAAAADATAAVPAPNARAAPATRALATGAPLSVRSSPSPSASSASVADSAVADRRLRYPTYSSPARSAASIAPPSVWGGRDKPKSTPCLEPPDVWGGRDGDDSGAPDEQSYFFGTPSAASTQPGDGPVQPAPRPAVGTSATARAQARQHSQSRRPDAGTPESPIDVDSSARALSSSAASPCVRADRVRRARQSRGQPPCPAAAASPVRVYIPPYLRRLQRLPATAPNRNDSKTSAVIDLTGDGAPPATRTPRTAAASAPPTPPTSATAASGRWQPSLHTVRESGGEGSQPRAGGTGARPGSGARTRPRGVVRRRGVATPVRRGRGAAARAFPDLSTYRYDDVPDWV